MMCESCEFLCCYYKRGLPPFARPEMTVTHLESHYFCTYSHRPHHTPSSYARLPFLRKDNNKKYLKQHRQRCETATGYVPIHPNGHEESPPASIRRLNAAPPQCDLDILPGPGQIDIESENQNPSESSPQGFPDEIASQSSEYLSDDETDCTHQDRIPNERLCPLNSLEQGIALLLENVRVHNNVSQGALSQLCDRMQWLFGQERFIPKDKRPPVDWSCLGKKQFRKTQVDEALKFKIGQEEHRFGNESVYCNKISDVLSVYLTSSQVDQLVFQPMYGSHWRLCLHGFAVKIGRAHV